MRVHLVGYTVFNHTVAQRAEPRFFPDPNATAAETLSEFGGRACYQSWRRPNPVTATVQGYFSNILASGHFSVLEHASVSFYVQGVSRSLSHELIRHRHFSYSQLSQRFVDESEVEFILPPTLREVGANNGHPVSDMENDWTDAQRDNVMDGYLAIVEALTAEGYSRKQAREAARSVLPNCTETKILVTGNHRAWRDFLAKRHSIHADAEIKQFAAEVLRQLRPMAPNFYTDIPEESFQ